MIEMVLFDVDFVHTGFKVYFLAYIIDFNIFIHQTVQLSLFSKLFSVLDIFLKHVGIYIKILLS